MVKFMLLIVLGFIKVVFASPIDEGATLKSALTEKLNLNQDFDIILEAQRCKCMQPPADTIVQNLKLESDQRRFSASVKCGQEDDAKQCQVRGRIQLLSEIPVLNRTINAGEIVTEADIVWQKIPINKINGNVLTTLNDIIGKTSPNRMLHPGKPLQRSDLKASKIVKKGDLVRVVYKEEGMTLSVQAIAKHDATKGESLALISPMSKREIRAVVVAPQQAEINPVSF